MAQAHFIRIVLIALLAIAAGCATPPPLEPTPLGQDELDNFLASGRDARTYGITIYRDPAGARFEFANRVHPHRGAQMDIVSPSPLTLPIIRARTGRFIDCQVLLDTSARHSWLLLPAAEAMDYRVFAPPIGEYPDHVLSDLPGYAGVANKLVFDTLHMESPIFYVLPARGGFGPLARYNEQPGHTPKTDKVREKLSRRTHVIFGAAPMQTFSFVRFDFPGRTVRFSTDATYRTEDAGTVLTRLPLKSWRGRPAVEGQLDDTPLLLLIDTAGEFDLSLPSTTPAGTTLALGDLVMDEFRPSFHEEHGLPAAFPARLGLGLLARHILVIDYKQRQVWFETPLRKTGVSAITTTDATTAPVHYRGITP